jgi:hypothetical protein
MSASNRQVPNSNLEAKEDHSSLVVDEATFNELLKASARQVELHKAAEDRMLADLIADHEKAEKARLKRIADAKAADADFERILLETGQSEGDRIAAQAMARANAERERFEREAREEEAAEALLAAQLRAAAIQAERDREAKAQALLIKQAIEKAAEEAQRQNALKAQIQAEKLRQIEDMAKVEQAAAQRKQLDKERSDLFTKGVDLLQYLAQYEKPEQALQRYDAFAALHADKNSDQASINDSMRALVTALPQMIEAKEKERNSQVQARQAKQKAASEANALLQQQETARLQAIQAQQIHAAAEQAAKDKIVFEAKAKIEAERVKAAKLAADQLKAQAAEKAAQEKTEQKQKAKAETDRLIAAKAAQDKIAAEIAAQQKAEQATQAKLEAHKAAAVKAEADRIKAEQEKAAALQARTEAYAKEKAQTRSQFFFMGKENDPRRIPGVEVMSPTRVFSNHKIFDTKISNEELLRLKEYAKQKKAADSVDLNDHADNSQYSSSSFTKNSKR